MVPFDGLDATRTTDEQFLQLLLADEELLRAEFDALIAAEWSGSPPRGTDRCGACRPTPDPATATSMACRRLDRRSPPSRDQRVGASTLTSAVTIDALDNT